MSSRKRLLKNVSWNWIGMAVEAAVGFMILPLLVSRLGVEGYGLWVIIGSLTGSLQFLDFGFRGSVGRFVAYYSTLDDNEALSKVLSTATAMLTGLGAIAFTGVAILSFFLPHLIEVPAGQLESARLALLLVGAHLGLWLVLRIFDGALWGLQRFDLLNIIDGSLALTRLALVYFLVTEANGLVTLAWITIAMTLATGLIKAGFSISLMKNVRVRRHSFDRSALKELMGYGVWNFVASLSNMTVKSLFPVLIGGVLGLAFVAPFAIAKRLIEIVQQFMVAATGVLTPYNTALFAKNDLSQQRRVFLAVSKYCATIALLAVVGMSLLSESFLTLWVGAEFAYLWKMVAILSVGAFLPMVALLASGILQGMARHRSLALFGILNATLVFLLTGILGKVYGLTGACIALAISGTLFSGIAPLLVVIKVLGLSLAGYLRRSLLPAIGIVTGPALLLFLAVSYRKPENWLLFVSYGSVFSASVLGITYLMSRKSSKPPLPPDNQRLGSHNTENLSVAVSSGSH